MNVADICNAYESGVGHAGRQTAKVNPYREGTPEHEAYAIGSSGTKHNAQPAAVPEAVAKDAAPSCFTCIHGAKDDEDYPCRSCRMMSHWSSAAILSAADTEVKNG